MSAQIEIESDETGFVLVVASAGIVHRFGIEDPEGLANAVRADILPWLRERDQARAEYQTATPQGYVGEGYQDLAKETLADVGHKHPDWHSIHVDHYDNRDKTAGA